MKIEKIGKNFNDFVYSSEITRKEYSKFFIIKLDQKTVENIPFTLFQQQETFDIFENKIIIPSITKELAIYDQENDIIFTNGNVMNIKEYEQDLYKIDKIINNIKIFIHKLKFSILDFILQILEKINLILYDYYMSIQVINDDTLIHIYDKIKNNLKDTQDAVLTKGTYLDMKTNRFLTIISLITFPILMLSGWFGTNFPKNQMIFLTWKHSYLTITILCIIFMLLCLYIYKDDLKVLII